MSFFCCGVSYNSRKIEPYEPGEDSVTDQICQTPPLSGYSCNQIEALKVTDVIQQRHFILHVFSWPRCVSSSAAFFIESDQYIFLGCFTVYLAQENHYRGNVWGRRRCVETSSGEGNEQQEAETPPHCFLSHHIPGWLRCGSNHGNCEKLDRQ